ncbi:MAG: PucR family transcriptional regulator ligand-binding domain-containing protein [Actinomycetia bacterium]|nr:PucR family transcriptional regulator ligand-binding domain-containing protein [Actinomycetes bacterium]
MPNVPPPLTVEQLLASPALQLEAVAGRSGLGRRVSWAHVSELPDPTPWLLGAELLMTTGLAVPRAGAAQRDYLARLDDAGVTALALSDQLHVPPLRKAFTDEADARGFPVLRVPLSVPFIAVAQEVAAAVQSDMHRRLTAQLHVFGALRTLATEDLSVTELFARLERLSGYRLYICSSTGRPLLPGVPAPTDELAELLPESFDAPPAVPGGYALPVPAPGGPVGMVLAIERPGAAPAGLGVVQHIATIAGLQVAIRRHERETQRREGAETLAELLQGTLDTPSARRRLDRLGFGDEQELRIVVVRPVGADALVNDRDLLRSLDASETPSLALRQQRDLVLLVPAPTDLAGLASPGVAVGLSQPFPSDEPLVLPLREAQSAATRAASSGIPFVSYGRDPVGRWLVDDRTSLDGLIADVLGEALAYDARHGTSLVVSVRTWLERDRRTNETAEALHVHPNTLAYRVRRFERLSGRSLASTGDLAEVWLALSSRRDGYAPT